MSACALSLVMCTYQRERELAPLLDSLVAQHCRDFELLVVDQNVDDRLRPLLDHARERGVRVLHLRQSQPNLSTARNLGMRHAAGRWIGFPDDDCWYEPDLLAKLIEHVDAAPDCTVAIAHWAEFAQHAARPLELSWSRSRRFRDRLATSFMLFFDRRVFDRLGGFDPRLGVGQWYGAAEETDLLLRALHAGERAEFCAGAVVHHPLKPAAASTAAQRRALRQRERGTGALYAIHSLPLGVCCRGLLAPVLRQLLALCRPGVDADLRIGLLEVLGRAEGWLRWRRENRAVPATTAPVAET